MSTSVDSAAVPPQPESSEPSVPTVRRRLATLMYEGVLLFGVVFFAGYLFSTLTQQRNGLVHHNWLAAWVGLVVGVYFVWFWTHGGQTLPMKTWRLQIVGARGGAKVSVWRAVLRYVLAWLWFLPPLALHPLLGLSVPQTLGLAGVWFALYAGVGRLGAGRQFLHDRLAGTKVVTAHR
ncbi:RDD family protein [Paraburkholderia azotifigens]|uniref:RDD family protein n=1 Tax=Paraburkholderia azotifigens TaxID=2057004 RepID=A0A5C6VN12_9BURK|nr:RDD family protein [Paraburkholderia azotifigens]